MPPKGDRSQLISRAVVHFVEVQGKEALPKHLKREALANAERDVAMAAEWFPLEQEALGSRSPRQRRSKTRKPKSL